MVDRTSRNIDLNIQIANPLQISGLLSSPQVQSYRALQSKNHDLYSNLDLSQELLASEQPGAPTQNPLTFF